ncbi:porin [Duganella sp. P38]|uniref:porin n=1 Tax=Duganella sp. P38 TaxID=3423949 RepID=UPI003D7BDF67
MKNQQRHLAAALAAALLPATAPAQTTFTVSGMLDLGMYRATDRTWKMGTVQRSRIQFSGAEKLDDDLYVIFTLSPRFEMDTGGNEDGFKPIWHNETTVGLKGRLGTLQFGRRLDALYANDWAFDPWNYFDRLASPAWDLWHYNYPSDPRGNLGKPEYGRLNNGIYYDTPDINGFSAHFSGALDTEPGDRNRPLTGALQYRSGRLGAMVARGRNSAGNADTFVGLRAAFGNLSVMGAHDVSTAGVSTARASTLGMKYAAGVLTYRASVGQVRLDGVRAQGMFGAGVSYGLSRRTSVYLDYGRKLYPAEVSSNYGVGVTHLF